MNHLTKINKINEMNEKELVMKIFDWRKSWHVQYEESPYIYVGMFFFCLILVVSPKSTLKEI
ncbi:hypothetical protein MXB_1467 [Myxobolus squamalis]|nr:hypothetical protein MXB_1467 [Myxobolus squamalis]